MTTPTSVVTGVDFVTVFIRDFAAAVEFYGTLLGLPCSVEYGRIPGAEFETSAEIATTVMDDLENFFRGKPVKNRVTKAMLQRMT